MTDRSEQAGRADSSASERERAEQWMQRVPVDQSPWLCTNTRDIALASLANLIAAIRREAIEECREIARRHFTGIGIAQKIEAAMDALAGDAPATREES